MINTQSKEKNKQAHNFQSISSTVKSRGLELFGENWTPLRLAHTQRDRASMHASKHSTSWGPPSTSTESLHHYSYTTHSHIHWDERDEGQRKRIKEKSAFGENQNDRWIKKNGEMRKPVDGEGKENKSQTKRENQKRNMHYSEGIHFSNDQLSFFNLVYLLNIMQNWALITLFDERI